MPAVVEKLQGNGLRPFGGEEGLAMGVTVVQASHVNDFVIFEGGRDRIGAAVSNDRRNVIGSGGAIDTLSRGVDRNDSSLNVESQC